MATPNRVVVTGAFGYTGKYIARRLLAMGSQVLTLTGNPARVNPFGSQITVERFDFDNPRRLANTLRGAATFYNTYWVRFPYARVTFDTAVENSKVLWGACEQAGVRRVVHISVANASERSHLAYFKGKGMVETALAQSGLSYAIVRPTVLFGGEDVLINNIAWLLRRFPVFAVPGSGDYQIQPVFVEDVADIAIDVAQRSENIVVDAAGPEIFTFSEMVRLIARAIRSRARIVHLRPSLAAALSRMVGYWVRDVVLTGEEVEALMSNLLISHSPARAKTALSTWLAQNAGGFGTVYASELQRHYRR